MKTPPFPIVPGLRRSLWALVLSLGLGLPVALAVPFEEVPEEAPGERGVDAWARENAELRDVYNPVLRQFGAQDYAAAEAGLVGILIERPGDAPGHELLGLAQFAQEKYAAAKDSFEKAVGLRPSAASARIWLARLHMKKREYDQAEALFAKVKELAPKRPEPYFGLGIIREGQGKIDEAIANYEEGVKLEHPHYLGVKVNLGRLYIARGEMEKAIALFEPFAVEGQTNMSVFELLGVAYHGSGRSEDAIATFLKVRKLDAEADVSFALAKAYQRAQRPEEAEAELRRYIGTHPKGEEGYLQLASLLAEAGRPEAIPGVFEQAAVAAEDPLPWHLRIADYYQGRGEFDQALATLQGIATKFPGDPRGLERLGMARLAAGQVGAAVELFEKMQADQPDNPISYLRLGMIYGRLGKNDEALSQLEKADRMVSNDPAVGKTLVGAYLAAGQGEKAVAKAEELAKVFPEALDSQLLLANTHSRVGDNKKAVEIYRGILTMHPKHPLVLNNLANRLADEGQFSEAEQHARAALAVLPGSADLQDTLGWILVRGGKAQEGTAILKAAVEASPQSPGIHYHLAEGYAGQGNKALAIKHAKAALATKEPFAEATEAKKLLERLAP